MFHVPTSIIEVERLISCDIRKAETFFHVLSACAKTHTHTRVLLNMQYWVQYTRLLASCLGTLFISNLSLSFSLKNDCLIDLVSRAGQLNEAEDLIFNVHKEPSIVSFRTFLGACRHQIDVERAEHIAKQAFDLEPENDGVYLMLANMRFRSNFDVWNDITDN